MLTPFDLLARGWAGQSMSCRNTNLPVADAADFAARVEWTVGNTLPKPSLAEVEARRVELQAAYDLEQRQIRQRKALEQTDRLLTGLDILAEVTKDIAVKLRSQSLTAPLSASSLNKLDTVIATIAQIKAIP